MRGVDSRILVAQVPGGMLTNMESQLKEQGAADKMDEVLEEIPRVREDLGFIPLVTPRPRSWVPSRLSMCSPESAINPFQGNRRCTQGRVWRHALRRLIWHCRSGCWRVAGAITCRPADLLEPELVALTRELQDLAAEQSIALADGENAVDDVLTYALFPQVGLKFLQNRGDPGAFEPVPGEEPAADNAIASPTGSARPAAADTSAPAAADTAVYTVTVDGQDYRVKVAAGGEVTHMTSGAQTAPPVPHPGNAQPIATAQKPGQPIPALWRAISSRSTWPWVIASARAMWSCCWKQ